MSAAKLVVFTMLCFSVCAHAQTETLAVYSNSTPALDSITQNALDQELTRLLSPAGIQPVWRNQTRLPREEMGRLVVGRFEGNCFAETLSSFPRLRTQGAAFAETSISNGRILPYFSVDCARVIRTLAPTLQHLSVPFRNALLGRALARVIAHEIYHIFAQTTDHEESGLTKATLSLADLTANRFEFTPDSLRKIRASIHSTPPIPVAALAVPVAR
jgi:hypothetical protein